MQVYVLISMAMVLVQRERLAMDDGGAHVPTAVAFVAAWAPCAVGAALCWAVAAVACRRFDLATSGRRTDEARLAPARRAERFVRLVPWLALGAFAWALFAAGWLEAVRAVVGDTIVIDEFVALLPPMVMVVASWWFRHPLERRLWSLEASDGPAGAAGPAGRTGPDRMAVTRGRPGDAVDRSPSRASSVLQQARVNLLLLLAPMLAAIGLAEAVRTIVPRAWPSSPSWVAETAAAAAIAALFVTSPWLVRIVLGTRRLPEGELREALLDVCRRHRVGVSDLRVWETRGTMLNGAVVGLVPALRYVLLTDGLLHALPRDHLLAVMAHEVGHVRRRHMWIAGLGLLACAALGSMIVDGILAATWPDPATPGAADRWHAGAELGAAAAVVAFTLVGFGVVSRRLERQADVFAVAHLSGWASWGADRPAMAVSPRAVDTMCEALAAVCVRSGGDPWRRSWRHGSIAARQAYLRTLAGRPIDRLAIDRQVRWIAAGSAAVVAAALAIVASM